MDSQGAGTAVFVFTVFLTGSAFAQETWVKVEGPNVTCVKLQAIDEETLFVLGIVDLGIQPAIYRSTDGAETFEPAMDVPGINPGGMHWVSADEGFVWGLGLDGNQILHTTDAGQNFEVLPSYCGGNCQGNINLRVLSADEIAGIGTMDFMSAAVWTTTDGGGTWMEVATEPPEVSNLTPVSLTTYMRPKIRDLHRTTDGGATWEVSASVDTGNLGRVYPIDEQLVFIESNAVAILRSPDAGATLEAASIDTDIEPGQLDAIAFADANNGVASIAQSNDALPRLVRTTDGGSSWTTDILPDDYNENDLQQPGCVAFPSPARAYAANSTGGDYPMMRWGEGGAPSNNAANNSSSNNSNPTNGSSNNGVPNSNTSPNNNTSSNNNTSTDGTNSSTDGGGGGDSDGGGCSSAVAAPVPSIVVLFMAMLLARRRF